MILEITVDISSENSENVLKALSPDNVKIPPDLELKMVREGKRLKIMIKSENIKRARSTLDEILSLISSIEKLK